MEGRNLLAPSQVRYLVGKGTAYLGQRCTLDKMRKDRAVE